MSNELVEAAAKKVTTPLWLSHQDSYVRELFCPRHYNYWGYRGSLGCKECISEQG